MFAVIKAAGKQFRVAANDTITLSRQAGEPGAAIAFGEVLMLTTDGKTTVGSPLIDGVTVAGEIVAHERGDKVISFKKRRRKSSKRKRGYRDELTVVRITEILTGGKRPAAKAAAKPAAEAASTEAPAPEAAAPKAPKAKAKPKADAE